MCSATGFNRSADQPGVPVLPRRWLVGLPGRWSALEFACVRGDSASTAAASLVESNCLRCRWSLDCVDQYTG